MDTPYIGEKSFIKRHMIVQNALYCTLYIVMVATYLCLLIMIRLFVLSNDVLFWMYVGE